ncbi:MAG: SDR family oxidoreductase [Desulfobacteraceae bacterium]|nr:MAG: SDR family oxidoreductase [Desulfobacteraceae bacterium]
MILERFRLDGCIAVVTGGSKGIGEGVTLALAEAGADVAVVSRRPNPALEDAVRRMGRRFHHHMADLTDRDQTKRVVSETVNALGDLHILVNNAGVCLRAAAADFSESDWDATLEIDLTAAFILSQAAGRWMLRKKRGKIINIGSVLSFQGGINVAAYTAAKHGVAGLTKALSNEWAKAGINVNAIAPGYIATELTYALQNDPVRSKSILSRIPAGRWGSSEDIAGAAVFLASPASDYINGTVLSVDGGWLAW